MAELMRELNQAMEEQHLAHPPHKPAAEKAH